MTADTFLHRPITDEAARAVLLAIADEVDTEDRRSGSPAPFSDALDCLIPALSPVPDPVPLFSQLVAAVAEFRRFCSNERDWLHAHELPDTDDMREAWHGRLDSDVQCWAGRLLGEA